MSGFDVLAVMDEYVESCAHCDGKGQCPIGEPYCDNGPTIDLEACIECAEIRQARAAVAELIEASKLIEAHNAGATMSEWERFGDALAKVTGASDGR